MNPTHVREYLGKNGFRVEKISGGVVLQGTRPGPRGTTDVVQFIAAKDGRKSVETLLVGIRIDEVDSRLEQYRMEKWTIPESAPLRAFSIPSRMSIYQYIEADSSEEPWSLERIERLISRSIADLRDRFSSVGAIRDEVVRRKGFGERRGAPVVDGDWKLWKQIFDEVFPTGAN